MQVNPAMLMKVQDRLAPWAFAPDPAAVLHWHLTPGTWHLKMQVHPAMLMKIQNRAKWSWWRSACAAAPLTPDTWHLTPENAGAFGYVEENEQARFLGGNRTVETCHSFELQCPSRSKTTVQATKT
jgi:hypothetical protein